MASSLTWGLGQAKLVRAAKHEEVVAFIPDTHVPFHDQDLVNSAIRLVGDLKPHRVVHLGDLTDFHQISRWNTTNDRLDSLQEEIDEGFALLKRLRDVAPDAAFELCMGNHDIRLRKYVLEKGGALQSIRALDYKTLFRLGELDIRLHQDHGFLLRKNFIVRHGTLIRQGAGNSAKAECMAARISGISGHTHRAGQFRMNGYQSLDWTECGTLSRLDAPYVPGIPDWTQAVAIGYFGRKSHVVELAYAREGKIWYGGRSW